MAKTTPFNRLAPAVKMAWLPRPAKTLGERHISSGQPMRLIIPASSDRGHAKAADYALLTCDPPSTQVRARNARAIVLTILRTASWSVGMPDRVQERDMERRCHPVVKDGRRSPGGF